MPPVQQVSRPDAPGVASGDQDDLAEMGALLDDLVRPGGFRRRKAGVDDRPQPPGQGALPQLPAVPGVEVAPSPCEPRHGQSGDGLRPGEEVEGAYGATARVADRAFPTRRLPMQAHDPRARPSRTRLRKAILELAATKEIGAITMSEIARQAGVNRATVYQHFPDVNALVTNAMADAVAHVARAAALCPLDAPRDEAPPPLHALFRRVSDSRPLYRRMLATRGTRCSPRACGSG